MNRRGIECAPPWVIDKAVKEEVKSNWSGSYEEVYELSVPRHSNIIRSHIVYNVKSEEGVSKRFKARLCPHGNRDIMKDEVRKYSEAKNGPM